MKKLYFAFIALSCIMTTRAAIHTETVEYKQGDTTLEGFLAYDDAIPGLRPGVLVVHQWMGLTDYEKKRAEMLAQLGYVAFCADIYGKGVRPQNPREAGALAGKYKGDRHLLRARVNAGLDALRQQPLVDTKRIAAIGYCFGGTTVLELARSGADLNGVVSFHGGLDSPTPADGKNIKCKVLALPARMIRFRIPTTWPRLKTKCATEKWTGRLIFTAARFTPSPNGTRATIIPKARPTTKKPTNVRGRR